MRDTLKVLAQNYPRVAGSTSPKQAIGRTLHPGKMPPVGGPAVSHSAVGGDIPRRYTLHWGQQVLGAIPNVPHSLYLSEPRPYVWTKEGCAIVKPTQSNLTGI